MQRPCDNCTTNIDQAILYDEVTCYLTCKDWLEWRELESGEKRASEVVQV